MQEEYVCAAVRWHSINTVAILRINRENIVQKRYVCTKERTRKKIYVELGDGNITPLCRDNGKLRRDAVVSVLESARNACINLIKGR